MQRAITPALNPDVPLPAQPAGAVQAIRLFMGPIPAALLLLAIFFAWRFPITREGHRALRDQLGERLALGTWS